MRHARKEFWFEVLERRAYLNITPQVEEFVGESGIANGLCLVNPMHITAAVYVNDDERLDSDVQFGVTRALIGNYVRHDSETAPAGDVKGPWYSLEHTFVMEGGRAKLPRPPITGKARGERPKIPHLA